MAGYTIGETAERSGFSASTLRYYEDIDLVRPAGRTEAGYRLYDDAALARLRFVARAKQLGCSLEDIRDLVAVRGDERCRPVQRRFHELVRTKLADAHRQMDELRAFTAQLDAAATHLAGPAADGPCSDDCACTTAITPQAAPSTPATLVARPTERGDARPIACTLGAEALPGRVAEWRTMLSHARSRSTTPAGAVRVDFDEDVDVAELARLVAAERRCCSFFAFAITVDERGVALEIDAPDEGAELIGSLFA